MGELALARGDFGTARSHSAECLELATRTGSRKNLVKAWRLAGEIAKAERDGDAAEGHFRTSRDLALALGNPVQQWKAELALGGFLQDAGRADQARQAFERASLVMEHVGRTLRKGPLREAFDKNTDLRLVRSLVGDL
jgi:tetratricopeptide (TPR) repeat protein